MKAINLISYTRIYPMNIGHDAENLASLHLTGKPKKPDNKPFWVGGDIGDLQVKGYRATVCDGTDLDAHLAKDKATQYGYVTRDLKVLYIMTPEEYRDFVKAFSRVEKSSQVGHNGEPKIRLKHESIEMEMYLRKHTA